MGEARANMDVDITAQDVASLASADALAAFFQRLGYDTAKRAKLFPEAIGLADPDGALRHLELLSEDPEGFLRIVFGQLRSITAKARNDLVRTLGRFSQDHPIVLVSDFQVLEFLLIDKVKRHQHGPAAGAAYKPVPKVYSVQRKAPSRLDLRILRRLTFTQRDGLDQFDKLRSVFEAAVFTGEYYQNRALFADHYLNTRLQESAAWAESPDAAFSAVRGLLADARERLAGKGEAVTRKELIEPLWKALGFRHTVAKGNKDAGPTPRRPAWHTGTRPAGFSDQSHPGRHAPPPPESAGTAASCPAPRRTPTPAAPGDRPATRRPGTALASSPDSGPAAVAAGCPTPPPPPSGRGREEQRTGPGEPIGIPTLGGWLPYSYSASYPTDALQSRNLAVTRMKI
jgi:hypothetical protein